MVECGMVLLEEMVLDIVEMVLLELDVLLLLLRMGGMGWLGIDNG